MPTRSQAQRTGSKAELLVQNIIDSHPRWLARPQSHDFGIDLEAEMAEPEGDDQRLIGKLLKIQVKGSNARKQNNGRIPVSLPRDYIDYVGQLRIPVILVTVDLREGQLRYLWLQDWQLENEARLVESNKMATVTVHVPAHQTLAEGLDGPLQKIAAGETATTMILALRELITLAIATRNLVLFETVLDLLNKTQPASRNWAIQKTIDHLLGFGPNAGLWQSSQLVPQLLTIADRVGDALTQDQVVRLVARSDSYSRAALYSLSRLYDRWHEHIRSLGLPEKFRELGIENLAWYCDLRERYAALSSLDLWDALGNNRLTETQFGALKLREDETVGDDILRRWPNRGDSIFLDNLVWIDR